MGKLARCWQAWQDTRRRVCRNLPQRRCRWVEQLVNGPQGILGDGPAGGEAERRRALFWDLTGRFQADEEAVIKRQQKDTRILGSEEPVEGKQGCA